MFDDSQENDTNDKIELLFNGMKEQIKALCAENYELHNKISVKDKQLEEMSEKLKLIEEILKPTHKKDSTIHTLPKVLSDFKPSRTQNINFELEEKLREIFEKYKQSEENLSRLRDEHEKQCSNKSSIMQMKNSKLEEKLSEISEKYTKSEELEELCKKKSLLDGEISERYKQSEDNLTRHRNEKLRKKKSLFQETLERYQNELDNNKDVLNNFSQKESENYENQQKYDENNKERRALIRSAANNKEKEQLELLKKNTKLKTEESKYQTTLGNATYIRMNDDDKDHGVQLVNNILSLRDTLRSYISSLKWGIEIDIDQINNLMKEYNVTITSKPNYPLIKALLSFHILMKIMKEVESFFEKNNDSSSVLHLEADIMSKSKNLEERLVEFSKTRNEKDLMTQMTSIKIRQEVNIALSNRGFSDNMAPKLIRELIRIFWFRLRIQEPVAQIKWVEVGSDIDPNVMDGIWDNEDIDDLEVEVCAFPMIGRDLENLEKRKIYTHAHVFTKRKTSITKTKTIKRGEVP
ncbi:16692_t:CDS:2 [Funneliformis geosporum]|uniref:16692_t:CDS:1 n=1 Tax=Funneliformis geosporum TaxID=1117311 RepID=A0A9W4S9D0_9GLOM|nr:16692_t:CDS:2 [Funneliformis geosporum]